MKASIQLLIQHVVIRTSFPPFTYLYRRLYELSVAIATLWLRRIDGVSAIHLRRGLAKGQVNSRGQVMVEINKFQDICQMLEYLRSQ